MGMMVQFQPSPVFLNCCWSDSCNPKLRACLWITESSCQNWQPKCHQSISQGEMPRKSRARQEQHTRAELWGSLCLPNTPQAGCRAQCRELGLTGSSFGFLDCFEKSHMDPWQWNTGPKYLIRFSAEWDGKNKNKKYIKKKAICVQCSQKSQKWPCRAWPLPRVEATLHFTGISNTFGSQVFYWTESELLHFMDGY